MGADPGRGSRSRSSATSTTCSTRCSGRGGWVDLPKAGTDTVDGDDVVAIDNKDPENGDSTGYVLVDDPHYLVKIEKTDGGDTGTW